MTDHAFLVIIADSLSWDLSIYLSIYVSIYRDCCWKCHIFTAGNSIKQQREERYVCLKPSVFWTNSIRRSGSWKQAAEPKSTPRGKKEKKRKEKKKKATCREVFLQNTTHTLRGEVRVRGWNHFQSSTLSQWKPHLVLVSRTFLPPNDSKQLAHRTQNRCRRTTIGPNGFAGARGGLRTGLFSLLPQRKDCRDGGGKGRLRRRQRRRRGENQLLLYLHRNRSNMDRFALSQGHSNPTDLKDVAASWALATPIFHGEEKHISIHHEEERSLKNGPMKNREEAHLALTTTARSSSEGGSPQIAPELPDPRTPPLPAPRHWSYCHPTQQSGDKGPTTQQQPRANLTSAAHHSAVALHPLTRLRRRREQDAFIFTF